MIALDAIKARLAAATEFIRADYTSDGDRYCVACNEYFLLNDGCEYEPGESVCDPCAQRLWRHAPADIAALIEEVERLRAALDGPPICACGSLFDEHYIAESEEGPACYLYTCQNDECGWQIGNNGEITERLTLRTNPQTERLIARIFGLTDR